MRQVFLSFAPHDLNKVKGLLPYFSDGGYEIDFIEIPLDTDFDSSAAQAIKHKIGEKIVKTDTTVCLIAEDTHKSPWVNCQLQKTINKGNRIIAMALKKVEFAVLPTIIKEQNLKFYPWGPAKLSELIQA